MEHSYAHAHTQVVKRVAGRIEEKDKRVILIERPLTLPDNDDITTKAIVLLCI